MTAGAASPYEEFSARLDAVAAGLRRAAETLTPAGALTAPDPPTGERWDAGQVWAHLAEILPYWIVEGRKVVSSAEAEPTPFGRVKADEGRIAAIEARRRDPVAALAATMQADITVLRSFLAEVEAAPGGWERTGAHSTLGTMTLTRIVEEFLVGHLEQHLAQLDSLAGRSSG